MVRHRRLIALGILGLAWAMSPGCEYNDRNSRILVDAEDLFGRRDFDADPTKVYQPVSLRDVMSAPSQHKGVDVIFGALFHRYETLHTPFYTQYSPEDYIAFSVWPADARLSNLGERKKDLPFVFVKKDNPNLKYFLNLNMYAPLEIKGTVQSDFHGFAWIHAYFNRIMGKPVYSRAGLHHLINGFESAEKGNIDLAAAHFEKARNEDMPSSERTAMEKYMGSSPVVEELRTKGEEIEALKQTVSAQAQHLEQAKAVTDEMLAKRESEWKAEMDKFRSETAAKDEASAAQMKHVSDQVANLTKNVEDQKNQIAEREKTEATLKDEIAQLKKAHEEMGTRNTEFESERQKLNEQVGTLARNVEERDKKIEALNAEMEQLKKTHEDLKSKTGSASEEMKKLSDQIAELNKTVQEREAQLAERQKAMDALNADLQNRQTEADKLKREIEEMKKSSSSSDETARAKMAEMEERLKQHSEKMDAQQKQLDEKQKSLDAVTVDLETKKGEMEQLRKTLDETRQAAGDAGSSLRNKITELESQMSGLQKERDDLNAKLAEAQKAAQQLPSSEEDVKTLRKRVEALQKEIEALLKEKELEMEK